MYKLIFMIAMTVLLASRPPISSVAEWYQDGSQRMYETDETVATEGWMADNQETYYIGANGYMQTGWIQVAGSWYFLNTIHDGTYGNTLKGWQWIDGYCYYFQDDGQMLSSAETPDGWLVNELGAWVVNGQIQFVPEKGIITMKPVTKTVKLIRGNSNGILEEVSTPSDARLADSRLADSRTGKVQEAEDTIEKGNTELEKWLDQAKAEEARITGEDIANIPARRFLAFDSSQNNERLITITGHLAESQEAIVYVIGKNMIPTGTILAELYRDEIEYSNSVEAEIMIDADVYTISRFAVSRGIRKENCQHTWSVTLDKYAVCLAKGWETYTCATCGLQAKIILPPMGHTDGNHDSVCDRCNTRSFTQSLGSTLETEIAIEGNISRKLNFVCVNEDDQNGMLYVSEDAIPVSDFGGYGNLEYTSSRPERYFESGWQNAFSITGDSLMPMTVEGSAAYATILSKEEAAAYQEYFTGDYLTRSVLGDGLAVVKHDGTIEEINPESGNYGVRPAILLKKPNVGSLEKIHWNIGDIQARKIDGETYLFRCIDQNYSDRSETHRQAALFLCDTVIPADTGSEYRLQRLPDGSENYVFHPGPIVNFGTSNDYKYSNIRKWLQKSTSNFYGTGDINTGISYAYTGATEEKTYSQLKESSLTASYIGSQRLVDKVFILSVEEALKYKDWLWKFEGSETENPDIQFGAFRQGYWLRNPMGTSQGSDTDLIYMVDLVGGNIRPVAISPHGLLEDEEVNVTGTTGVRPAFTMPQD